MTERDPIPVPEHELEKAQVLGRVAKLEGKPESACPFALPSMRARWLGGWDMEEAPEQGRTP